MSVYLAERTGLGADAAENSMGASDSSHEDGPLNSGVSRAGDRREESTVTRSPGASLPPASYREADDHVQLALVESSHAEANLGLLVRGLQHLLAGASAARDAHASLTRELASLRELLARGNEAEQAALARLRAAEDTLAFLRADTERERARFIEEEDRFLAELIGDHFREVEELRAKLDAALARANAASAAITAAREATGTRLGSAATQPSLPAANWPPPPAPASPVPEWPAPDASFALSDWAPQPPFSLAEFAEERRSDAFEKELANARDSNRPTPVEPAEGSALIDRATGRALDPEETPLPTWQAISTLESLRAPEPSAEGAPEEELPVATSRKRATLPAMPPPPAPAAAPAPGDPVPTAPPRSGQVIAVIKPRSVKIPRHTPPPSLPQEDEPEPLTVRPSSPQPPDVVSDDRAPHLVDTVRPPPLIRSKPDLSQRPLREYSLGSTEVAEERAFGSRAPEPDRSS